MYILKEEILTRLANHLSGYLRGWAAEGGAAGGYRFAETFHYYGL